MMRGGFSTPDVQVQIEFTAGERALLVEALREKAELFDDDREWSGQLLDMADTLEEEGEIEQFTERDWCELANLLPGSDMTPEEDALQDKITAALDEADVDY